jgi:hypothetical protein
MISVSVLHVHFIIWLLVVYAEGFISLNQVRCFRVHFVLDRRVVGAEGRVGTC